MNDSYNFALDNSGYDAFSWFDISPVDIDGGQTLSFPDYVYGTILEIVPESPASLMIKMRTVDGTSTIKIVPGTNFIGCLPDDLSKGCKLAIAVGQDEEVAVARKVMMFSGG